MLLDAASGGTFTSNTTERARQLLENMAMNSHQWGNVRGPRKPVNVVDMDASSVVLAKLDMLTKQVEEIKIANTNASSSSFNVSCDQCGQGGHTSSQCDVGNPFAPESVSFVAGGNQGSYNNNKFGNTYNPTWKNHPNLSWGGNNNNNTFNQPQRHQQQGGQSNPQGNSNSHSYQPPHRRQEGSDDPLSKLIEMQKNSESRISALESLITQQHTKQDIAASKQDATSIKLDKLTDTVTMLVQAMTQRIPGTLPSNTEVNPKEEAKMVVTRGGRARDDHEASTSFTSEPIMGSDKDEPQQVPQKKGKAHATLELEEDDPQRATQEKASSPEGSIKLNPSSSSNPHKPKIPYPKRMESNYNDMQYKKFLEMFSKLHVNIPILEAICQMPRYTKFLKDIISSRRAIEESGMVQMTARCSAILTQKLPKKQKDPGSFAIPCTIGDVNFRKSLCDLGVGGDVGVGGDGGDGGGGDVGGDVALKLTGIGSWRRCCSQTYSKRNFTEFREKTYSFFKSC